MNWKIIYPLKILKLFTPCNLRKGVGKAQAFLTNC